ncbi:hypothetical protein [Sphingomonas sp. Y38-1Y]|uniref:hypothetical protein n=1 Tax=Sphingomonas sp. Y38-1Y TaxID=3078265 RepID=UPI0028E846C5|nr:hypothetical protein [Sphingomonas sp. Y38-1Y]
MVNAIDGGGYSSVRPMPPAAAPAARSVVEARIEETALFAQEYHGDPTYPISETMADPSLSQAQKDEFLARVTDLATGTDGGYSTDLGTLDDRARQELVTSLEEIGVAYTGSATPELRDQVTAAMGRNIDSGRITADQISALVDPSVNPASDGVRQLLTTATDGAVLQNVAYDLYGASLRLGTDLDSQDGAAGQLSLVAAADIAGMAAEHGYSAAANGVTAHLADNPDLLETIDRLPMNVYGTTPPGRGGFDAVASALAGTNNLFAQDKFDTVFSAMVDKAGADGTISTGEGLNALGDYFARHTGRLNTEAGYAGGWNEAAEDAKPPTPYDGLSERFVRNVMLGEDFSNTAVNDAIADELSRSGAVVGAPDGQYAPNEAERTEAALQFGTLIGSLQGAANAYVAAEKSGAEETAGNVRLVTDLITDKALSKTGPLGQAFGGELIDRIESAYVDSATTAASDDVDAQIGNLNELSQVINDAMVAELRENFPANTANETGVNGPGIVIDYESTVDIHRTNPAE